jgi:hypothetical protein
MPSPQSEERGQQHGHREAAENGDAQLPTGHVTGLIQALGTVWGLFRHYWVLFKLS